MAIKQDRVIALLNESDVLKRQRDGIVAHIRMMLLAGLKDDESTKGDLCAVVENYLAQLPHIPWERHVIERYHFDRNERRNTKQAEHLQHRRKQHLFAAPGTLFPATQARSRLQARSATTTAAPTTPDPADRDQLAFIAAEEAEYSEAEARETLAFSPTPDAFAPASGPVPQRLLDLANGDESLARDLWEDEQRYPAPTT